jgi:FG-GAP-like repeat
MKKAGKLVLSFLIIAAGLYFFIRKKNKVRRENYVLHQHSFSKDDIVEGGLLAKKYCQSCHLFPEPELLSRAKWKNVLPQMGVRLGIKMYNGQSYLESVNSKNLVIPQKPILTADEWRKIIDYYQLRSPLFLMPGGNPMQVERQMPFFSILAPGDRFMGKQTLASYVKIDTTTKPAKIWVANAQTNQLFLFNQKLELIDSLTTPGPVVDMSFTKNQTFICIIGKDLAANDEQTGSIRQIKVGASGKLHLSAIPLFNELARPVQIINVDLNGDHKADYLICEFGNLTGALLWMENNGKGGYTRHIISDLPGAIKAYVQFPDMGGLPNFWVLFTQGQESIVEFQNKGSGIFQKKTVLRFPPIYGSSFFEMVDMNRDGYLDIIYTCGDNGNATAVLKPYHGVYIFINDGKDNFHQVYFYPINGCYKALARDFDQDGLMDIAAIGLYTDNRRPEEGFEFLKGIGDLKFKSFSLPPDILFERGITMDAGDINADGKQDLVIGNAFFDFGPFGKNIREPLFYIFRKR